MTPFVRRRLAAAVLVGVALLAPDAFGQSSRPVPAALPPAEEAPSAPDAEQTLPMPTFVVGEPAPYVLPPAGWPVLEFPKPDPLLDRPSAPQPGFFADVEANVDWLHLRTQLSGPVFNPVTKKTDTVTFAGNRLDPAVSPQVEVGCRLPDGWGTLSVGWRYLASEGHDQQPPGPEDQNGRLDYTILDFSYTSWEFSLGPICEMHWGVGARMMFLFFDSRLQFLNPASAPGSPLAESFSNFDEAWGGRAFLELQRKIGPSGLAVFGRFEFTDNFARIHQTYTETVVGKSGAPPQFLELDVPTGSVGIPMAREVIGLSYTVPGWNYTRFMLGYEHETFFQIGRLSPISGLVDTRGQLDSQGLFLRAELNY
jgi:hypothetical protein